MAPKMSFRPKKRIDQLDDRDTNCRLKNGLNVHCLAQIFQYLDSGDLYTVGGMNDFYKQIINDLVIPKHTIDFYDIHDRSITIAQIFERYGKKIRKFCFDELDEAHTVEQLIKSIGQYCSIDQLRSIELRGNRMKLYEVGEMNELYKRTINDFIIPHYEIDLNEFHKNGISMSQIFERYGTNIRKLCLSENGDRHTTKQFLQLIAQYCSAGQLKNIDMSCSHQSMDVPIQFEKVEHLKLSNSNRISVKLSGSLRCLRLANVRLDPNFDWTTLTNLQELYLQAVSGINLANFKELIRDRPNLQVFAHDYSSLDGSIKDVGETMAKYCGNQIQKYSAKMPKQGPKRGRLLPPNVYDFISGFKNVKEVLLTTDQMCCGDLTNAIKLLAENDTIEKLCIVYSEIVTGERADSSCILMEIPNHEHIDMPHLGHLKRIELTGPTFSCNSLPDEKVCVPFKLFEVFGSQILSNVESIKIQCAVGDLDFIKFASKLRQLELNIIQHKMTFDEAAKILSNLKTIIQNRKREQTESTDFIHINLWTSTILNLFDDINDSEFITCSF